MMLLSIYSISVCQREVTIFFFITQLTNTSSDDDQKESIAQKNDDDDDDKVSVGFLPLSLSVYSIFFKRTMRVVVYLSPAFMKEEDETGDRQISFFFSLSLSLLYSINVCRCLLKENRKSRAILVFLFLSLSIICPKIAQYDQFSANHWRRPIANFFPLSLVLYKDIGIFSPSITNRP